MTADHWVQLAIAIIPAAGLYLGVMRAQKGKEREQDEQRKATETAEAAARAATSAQQSDVLTTDLRELWGEALARVRDLEGQLAAKEREVLQARGEVLMAERAVDELQRELGRRNR